MAKIIHRIGDQKILELSGDEREFLDASRARFFELVEEAGIEPAEDAAVCEVCDEVVRAWHASSPESRPEPDEIVNCLGAVLGDQLCEKFGLSWALCEDESGTDFCAFRVKNDVAVFPMDAIAKRLEELPEGFVLELFAGYVDAFGGIENS